MKNYLFILITTFFLYSTTLYAQNYISYQNASLQILNKVIAHSVVASISTNQPVIVDNKIIIKLEACYTTQPNQIPETIALLQIKKLKIQRNTRIAEEIFHGWMFANHPAVSSLEDPLYDVRVLNCIPTTKPLHEKIKIQQTKK